MIGKTILVILWFPLTLILLIINLTLLTASVHQGVAANLDEVFPTQNINRVTATAGTTQILGAQIIAGDARGLLLENFLQKYDSPMAPFAYQIVQEADANGLDFRLLPAIAMCESNLGKRIPGKDSFNAFGIAVYSGQQRGKNFQNWEQSISWVSNYIKTNYYDRGIRGLSDIGKIWAPPTEANGGGWSKCVSEYQLSII